MSIHKHKPPNSFSFENFIILRLKTELITLPTDESVGRWASVAKDGQKCQTQVELKHSSYNFPNRQFSSSSQ